MENVQEINFDGSIYDEIIRQAIRNFEATLNFFDELHQFQTEPDLGYESGNECNAEIINEPDMQSRLVLPTNSEIEADEGIENE